MLRDQNCCFVTLWCFTVKYCPICLLFFPVSTVFPSPLSLMEAKRSQSISNCAHLYEALPTTKSVPMLLHTVSSFLPGISSGNSACSHRLSGKVHSESCTYLCICLLLPHLLRHHFTSFCVVEIVFGSEL